MSVGRSRMKFKSLTSLQLGSLEYAVNVEGKRIPLQIKMEVNPVSLLTSL